MAAALAIALLIELVSSGIELKGHCDRLRYRPRSAMTPELAARVKAHKPDLLAILADGDRTTPDYTSKGRWLQAEQVATDPARWYTDDPGGVLPAGVVDLAQPRDGWPPGAWLDRLLQLAGGCQDVNPACATELRLAAIALTPDCHEEYQERAAIFEYETTPMTPDEFAQAESATTLEQLAAVFHDPERRRQAETNALAQALRTMKSRALVAG